MRNLEGSGWMTSPDLSVIEAKGENKGLPYEFNLQVKLANPNAPKDTNGDGVPDAPAPAVTAPVPASTGAAPAAATTPAPVPAAPATTTAPAPAAGGAP
jgi:type IV pilus assembly protein PilN